VSIASNICRIAFASATFFLEREADGRAHPVDVGAGAEARAVTREHDGARATEIDECLGKLGDQLRVERVAAVGTRERDAQRVTVALDAKIRHDARA
jgi:hypothetical protein